MIDRFGLADLHKIVFVHDRVYAWDAVLSAMLISDDGGKSFTEHFTPRGLIIDFEVDPADPDTIVAATEEQLYRSTDGGDSWRPALRELGVRVNWPEPDDALSSPPRTGASSARPTAVTPSRSVGRVDGEPYVLKQGGDGLLLALSDGTVLTSADDGASWEEVFRP